MEPLPWAWQVSGIKILEFLERLPGAVCKLPQCEGQVAPGTAVANRYVLFGAQFNESLNTETWLVSIPRITFGPSVELVEIGNDEG